VSIRLFFTDRYPIVASLIVKTVITGVLLSHQAFTTTKNQNNFAAARLTSST